MPSAERRSADLRALCDMHEGVLSPQIYVDESTRARPRWSPAPITARGLFEADDRAVSAGIQRALRGTMGRRYDKTILAKRVMRMAPGMVCTEDHRRSSAT